jgi:hypothetical protein
LLLGAPALLAQVPNCSLIAYHVTGAGTSAKNCAAFHWVGFNSYTTTWNFAHYCQNTENYAQYAAGNTSLSGTGECSQGPFGALIDCPPSYTSYTVSQQPGPYNSITWYAVNGYIRSGPLGVGLECAGAAGATVYTQCASQACHRVPNRSSPVVIDLDGEGFRLTDLEDGVLFDIDGGAGPVKIAWTAKGARLGFLALPGADGLVHSGLQLFGNYTPQPPTSDPNGFNALAVYDQPQNGGNGDGVIDRRDGVWPLLRVWVDANHDGRSTADEMFTPDEVGVNSISLSYRPDRRVDQYGNQFRFRAQMNPDQQDQVDKNAYDIFFVTCDR